MLMQNQDVDKRLKPDVFRAISDVALAVKGGIVDLVVEDRVGVIIQHSLSTCLL